MIDYAAAFFVAFTGVLLALANHDYNGVGRGVRLAATALMFVQAVSCLYAGWALVQ